MRKKCRGGVKPSVETAVLETASESMLDEEAGIVTLADEGVEAYAVGDKITHDDIRYVVTGDGEVEVGSFNGGVGSQATIPASFEEGSVTYRVTGIGTGAFYNCSSLSSVTIPEGVTGIGLRAFAGCSSLTSVTIPKSFILSLGDTSTQHTIFKDCVNLTTVTLSEKISRIPSCMFQGCAKLATLNILIEADGAVGFPGHPGNDTIGDDVFDGCPSGRKVVFWNADGTKRLTGDDWKNARDTYLSKNDGDTSDNLWYGWLLEEPLIEAPTTYTVTIHVNLDGNPWTNHNKTFALREDGDTEFVTDLAHVSNGTYSIYDITGVPADSLSSVARDAGMDTGVDVTVQDGNAEATVNYYTATFYDNNGSGTEAYGADTPQQPQIVLSGRGVAEPAGPTAPKDPAKAGWQFDGWKTEDGGSVPYDFNAGIGEKTDIYASWRSADTPVTAYTITVLAGDGGSISPSGPVVRVNRGDSAWFVITPDEGYRIKSVLVDGVDRTATLTDASGGGKSYTFTNVTRDHSIRVEFERDGGDNPNPNPDPGGDNPGGGGDNPTPGGDGGNGGGGTGDNSNPEDGGGHSGGGNNGGGNTNPDGGNTANPGNGNDVGNTQTAAGTETSSAQAGSNVTGVTTTGASGQTAGANGTAAGGKEPKTGDTAYWEVYATLAMVAGLTYLLLYIMEESRGMSEREKEAAVAAFIRWGKKGGAFRKCCAMAAIFGLLMYYHTIGKRAGESALRDRYLGQVS